MKKYLYQILFSIILVLTSGYIFLYFIKFNIGVSLKYEEWRLEELKSKIIFFDELLTGLKNCIIVLSLLLIISFLFKFFNFIRYFISKQDSDVFD